VGQIVVSDAVVLVEDEIREDQRLAIISPLGEFSAARGFEFHPNPIYLCLRDGDRIVGGLRAQPALVPRMAQPGL
jgi:hypothetical protein